MEPLIEETREPIKEAYTIARDVIGVELGLQTQRNMEGAPGRETYVNSEARVP